MEVPPKASFQYLPKVSLKGLPKASLGGSSKKQLSTSICYQHNSLANFKNVLDIVGENTSDLVEQNKELETKLKTESRKLENGTCKAATLRERVTTYKNDANELKKLVRELLTNGNYSQLKLFLDSYFVRNDHLQNYGFDLPANVDRPAIQPINQPIVVPMNEYIIKKNVYTRLKNSHRLVKRIHERLKNKKYSCGSTKARSLFANVIAHCSGAFLSVVETLLATGIQCFFITLV